MAGSANSFPFNYQQLSDSIEELGEGARIAALNVGEAERPTRPVVEPESGIVAFCCAHGNCNVVLWDYSRCIGDTAEHEVCLLGISEHLSQQSLADAKEYKVLPADRVELRDRFGVMAALGRFQSPRGCVLQRQISGAFELIVTESDGNKLHVLELAEDFSSCRRIRGIKAKPRSLHFPQQLAIYNNASNGERLLLQTDGVNHRIAVLAYGSGMTVRDIEPGFGWVSGVAVDQEAGTVFSASDKQACVHEIGSGKEILKIETVQGRYGAGVWVDSAGNLLSSENNTIQVRRRSGELACEIHFPGKASISGMCVDEVRQKLLVVRSDGMVEVYGRELVMVKSARKA